MPRETTVLIRSHLHWPENVTADADSEPNSESTVTGHYCTNAKASCIMFYASRLYDTRCKILFASQSFPSPNLDGFVLLPVRRRDLVLSRSNVAPVVTFPGTVFL